MFRCKVLKHAAITFFCLWPVSKADAEGLGTTISPSPSHPPQQHPLLIFSFKVHCHAVTLHCHTKKIKNPRNIHGVT
jgi:hypothetical protein